MNCIILNKPSVQELIKKYQSSDEEKPSVFERVLAYATVDLGCNIAVIEDNYICKDYRSEFSHLYSKVFEPFPNYATRLHFFKSRISEMDDVAHTDLAQAEYFGYCVLRPLRIGKVGRTIIKPAIMDEERYFHICTAIYHSHINGRDFPITGTPFIQQDSMLMCCSHAAVWVCTRYMHSAFGFSEVLPHEIAEVASKSFLTGERTVPTEGLSQLEIFNCFQTLGYSPFMLNKPRKEEYRDDSELEKALEVWKPIRNIYRYIESGIPVVVLVPNHAIVAVGHTLSKNRWHSPLKQKMDQTASILFSDEWVDGFIVQDDTGHPYTILPRSEEDELIFKKEIPHLLPPEHQRYRIAESDITGYIVPLPEKIYITAEHLDSIIKGILIDGPIALNLYFDALNASARNKMAEQFITSMANDSNPLVLRIYASESTKYKSALNNLDYNGISRSLAKKLIELHLPRFIWVVEITTADYMANDHSQRKVLAQLLIDATGNKFAMPLIAAHIPGSLYIRDLEKKYLTGPIEITDDIPQPMLMRKQMLTP